jgi:hypothetical protein
MVISGDFCHPVRALRDLDLLVIMGKDVKTFPSSFCLKRLPSLDAQYVITFKT